MDASILFTLALAAVAGAIVLLLGFAVVIANRSSSYPRTAAPAVAAPTPTAPAAPAAPASPPGGAKFKKTFKTIARVLGFTILTLALVFVAWLLLEWFMGTELNPPRWIASIPNNVIETIFSPTFLILLLLALAIMAIVTKGATSGILGGSAFLLSLVLLGVAFHPAINWGFEQITRGVNHGDWSDPAGDVDRVAGGTVKVSYKDTKHLLASGTIELRNASKGQCMHVQPEIPHKIARINEGFIVTKSSGELLYTITWSVNRFRATIKIPRGEAIPLTVIGIPIGEPRC